jgi:L-fuconate dehydratase
MVGGQQRSAGGAEGGLVQVRDIRIRGLRVVDVRFPTSLGSIGSDAVNKDPDYSAAYCILETDCEYEGHGLTFTLGRGNEIVVEAVRYLGKKAVGQTLASITRDLCGFSRQLTDDSQFRWLGPEKGVIHVAAGAVINAVWDLYAKAQGKPVWRLLAEMSPEQICSAVDFRYIDDAITRDEAIGILSRSQASMPERLKLLQAEGYPAYTTSAGWFGFNDEKVRRLCREGLAEGWTHFKLKVGGDPTNDLRRALLIREEIGWENKLMVDANQKWGVEEAIARTNMLAEAKPYWMEEPTNPDDILGHARIRREVMPIRIATGEHCHNRIIFKQLMQADAIDVCQIDSCRVAGVNENLAILLLAAKFGVVVCPHAGGVGLCEYVQHLSFFDYLRVSCSMEDRVIEYVDHLHEHFLDPVRILRGRYQMPTQPGYSIEMKPGTLVDYEFETGSAWRKQG